MILDIELLHLVIFLENLGYKVYDIDVVKDEIYVFIDKRLPKDILELFKGKKIYFYYYNNDYKELINRYFYNIFRKLPIIKEEDGKIIIEHSITEDFLPKFKPLFKFVKKVSKKEVEFINTYKKWKQTKQ